MWRLRSARSLIRRDGGRKRFSLENVTFVTKTVYFQLCSGTFRVSNSNFFLEIFFASKNHGTSMWIYRLFRSLFGPCHFDVEHGLDYPLENLNIYY